MVSWISPMWGVYKLYRNKPMFVVVHGNDELFVRNSQPFSCFRRAKKEITHYIDKGLVRAHHSALKKKIN
ncbi:hypothetical protein [Photobacterium damselae]|uniref:hypothetical protein n=1 Tax=Photobacterium damselae TaxID=38293 RepID=UPI001F340924|nr:hypothetical protein [Photobacterium damselae]UKA12828.1 hypothetical protein IHC91_21280 [Photobacterium damselae subsp. damselae]